VLSVWLIFYLLASALKLHRFGVEVRPLYALYKSTRMNAFLSRVGSWRPGIWRVFGNIGVASFFGQVAFMSYILFQNLYRFIFVPKEASPVMPLIPGVTISFQSLPWFLAAAGVVILLHELGHGVQCVVEGVKVKSAAVLVAILTIGGAVEPDEDSIKGAELMSRMRIFSIGSFVNLVTGLVIAILFYIMSGQIPGFTSSAFRSLCLVLTWVALACILTCLTLTFPITALDSRRLRARKGLRRLFRGSVALALASSFAGVVVTITFFISNVRLPDAVWVFLHWLYFLSINLALMNMLPIYPLDGGHMLRAYMETKQGWGKAIEKAAMFGFLGLMASNLVLSLARFGLIPL